MDPFNNATPYVEILKQPQSKIRFRYKTEGSTAGAIYAKSSSDKENSYPTIKVHNYTGSFHVVVSCVSKDNPYKVHPHQLVSSKNCNKGVYHVTVNHASVVPFPNLGIQQCKKSDIKASLELRRKMNVDPFGMGFDHMDHIKQIDLKNVRLCFQVIIKENGQQKPITPVVSDVITDSKSGSDLKICKMSADHSFTAGGEEVILLCDKVTRDDIEVHFYEEDKLSRIIWEDFGDVNYVHHQVAIGFKTPPYKFKIEGDKSHTVFLELRRTSDGTTSEPIQFKYIPGETENYQVSKKRKRDSEVHIMKNKDKFLSAPLKNEVAEKKVTVKLAENNNIMFPVKSNQQVLQPQQDHFNFNFSAASAGISAQPTVQSLSTINIAPLVPSNEQPKVPSDGQEIEVKLINIPVAEPATDSVIKVLDQNDKVIAVFPDNEIGKGKLNDFLLQGHSVSQTYTLPNSGSVDTSKVQTLDLRGIVMPSEEGMDQVTPCSTSNNSTTVSASIAVKQIENILYSFQSNADVQLINASG